MTADPLDAVLLRLAGRFEALRRDEHTVGPSCFPGCLGYVPDCTLEAMLEVCRGFYLVEMWPPADTEPWEADIQRKEGERPMHGEGPTPLAALARALDAAMEGRA